MIRYPPMSSPNNIGARIAKRQQQLGLTDTQVAASCRRTARTIANWKNGNSPPNSVDLIGLASVLDCHPMWLLGLRKTMGKGSEG